MTTRYGFEGGDPKTGTPAAEKPNVVKTVFGHEAHLPALKLRASEPGALTSQAAPTPAPRVNQPTVVAGSSHERNPAPGQAVIAKVRSKSAVPASPQPGTSKSARPGVARFLGRRNTAGNIVPLTQTEIQLPAAAWVRPALTVAVAAMGSFLIVATLLWIAGPKSPPPLARHEAAPVAMKPQAPIMAPPAPAPVPPSAPAADPPARRAVTAPHINAKQRAKWAAPKRNKPTDPDAPLPPTFF